MYPGLFVCSSLACMQANCLAVYPKWVCCKHAAVVALCMYPSAASPGASLGEVLMGSFQSEGICCDKE